MLARDIHTDVTSTILIHVDSDKDKVTGMSGSLPKFSLPWPAHVATVVAILLSMVLFHAVPIGNPWPLSLVIAVVALVLLAWIPMIDRVVRNRQGVAWSVRSLPGSGQAATRTARVAIWNYGFRTYRNRTGPGSDQFILTIVGLEPETKILDIAVVQTALEPIPFQIRFRADRHQAELSTHEIAIRKGAVFNVVHTGTRSTDLDISGDLAGVPPTYFSPSAIVTLPTANQLVTRPSVVLGVFILLALTVFWIHVGHFPLTLAFHAMITGLVVGTFGSFVTLILQGVTGGRGSRHFPSYVGLPVGLERFFEDGG